MLVLKLAFRNIFRQKRRSLFTAFSMVLGAVLMVITIGLEEGAYANMIDAFTGVQTGHAQIHDKEYLDRPGIYKNFEWNEELQNTLNSFPGVNIVSPRMFAGVLVFQDTATTGGTLKGVVPEIEKKATGLDKRVGKGSYFPDDVPHGAVISNRVAEIIKADVGDEIVLISQAADGSIANDIFKVTGILSKDLDSLESNSIFVRMEKAQEYLFLHGKVHQAAVFLDDYNNSVRFSKMINRELSEKGFDTVSAEPWEVIERQFYISMEADKEGSDIAFIIIIIVVVMGVLNTVMMSILERMKEYGVMKAIGTKPILIFSSIVMEAGILAFFSSVAGLLLGAAALWPLHTYGISYPEPVSIGGFFFTDMKADYIFKAFYLPPVIVVFSSIAAAVIPAYKAAVADPVETMKSY
ncbi:MAG: FtsX-like permease family protein [bacterium]